MKNDRVKNRDEIVCYCVGVTKGTIVDAILKGSTTLAKIKESTRACTGNECKTKNPSGKCCSGDILKLVKMFGDDVADEEGGCCCK